MKLLIENLQRDVLVLMASRGVRAFAFSCLGVIFTIYLNQLGYSTVTVGLVISTAYASGAVLTALWGFLSDRYGRRNFLGGLLQLIADCAFYGLFRNVKPPEEQGSVQPATL
ncbi:MAG TPA: MFS transporter [Methylomirabilota bacterium]|nr:MFS transporter [Methylomirabilota bacterium]